MSSAGLTFCAAALTSALGACDVPTALPKWDTTFVVQSGTTTLAAAQLLPASVTTTDEDAFAISVSPVAFSQDLAGLCTTCATLDRQNAPRPALYGSFGSLIPLPPDVAAAMLVAGQLNVTVENGFSFDPLRGDETATVTIVVKSGTNVIGTKVLTGAVDELPPGSTLVSSLPIAGPIEAGVSIDLSLSSPAGESATIDNGAKLKVTAKLSSLRASSARVRVQTRHVTARPIPLNVATLDRKIINGARSGAIQLSINNPLGVSGSLTLTLAGGARSVTRTVKFASGNSNVDVPLSEAELESILGHDVVMALTGNVSAAGDVTISPGEVITIASRLQLSIGASD